MCYLITVIVKDHGISELNEVCQIRYYKPSPSPLIPRNFLGLKTGSLSTWKILIFKSSVFKLGMVVHVYNTNT
jgi:hypothetical protein